MKRISATTVTVVWLDPTLPAAVQAALHEACSEEGWEISSTRNRARVLIGHLPADQRHLPEPLCAVLRERRDQPLLALCCEAPLREHHISLHGGCVHLLPCPQDLGEARALLAALAWQAQDDSATGPRSVLEEAHGQLRCALLPSVGHDNVSVDRNHDIGLLVQLQVARGGRLRCRLLAGRVSLQVPDDWQVCCLGACRIPDRAELPGTLDGMSLDQGDLLLALPSADAQLEQLARAGWPRVMDALAERLQTHDQAALVVGVA